MQPKKEEVFKKHINERYPDVDKIINSDDYNAYDLMNYINFQESPLKENFKGYDNWVKRNQMIDKLKRVGINGILPRSDVKGVEKSTLFDERGTAYKVFVIETDYGYLWVNENRQVEDITYR